MAVQGPIPVRFEDVFSHGAFAVSVEPMRDFERSQGAAFVQARDKASGELVWAVEVFDPDPAARDKAVRVKVAAPVQPTLPEAAPGLPFRAVEFDGLTVTPYVNGNNRLSFSLRAAAVRGPRPAQRPAPAREAGKDAGRETS